MKQTLASGLLLISSTFLVIVSASVNHRVAHDHAALLNQESLIHSKTHIGDDTDPVSTATRTYWMRRARSALLELTGSPCPFAAFGTAIVNHTGRGENDLGQLICIGANNVKSGNPTLHGEVAAINNCTAVLSSAPYNLTGSRIMSAWKDLSLYTTAEPCSMCASAVNWANFRELIYATSIPTLLNLKWVQIPLRSEEIFRRSPTGNRTRIVGPLLEEEMDELFGWQFNKNAKCPKDCVRENGGKCHSIAH